MEKKSFSENAKGFLSDWKKEYENDNKDIIERKKKRDEETAKLKAEFQKELQDYKNELEGKSKVLLDNMVVYFNSFTDAFMKGSATIAEKIQLEKRMDELSIFMKTAGEKGSEKFSGFVTKFKQKLDSFDKELVSEKATTSMEDEIEAMKKKADEELDKQNKSKEKDINDMKNIFGDL